MAAALEPETTTTMIKDRAKMNGIKGKLGEDVGQPGIRAGDTRVSHTSLKGECGTPGCPISEPSFPFIIMPKIILELLGNMHR